MRATMTLTIRSMGSRREVDFIVAKKTMGSLIWPSRHWDLTRSNHIQKMMGEPSMVKAHPSPRTSTAIPTT